MCMKDIPIAASSFQEYYLYNINKLFNISLNKMSASKLKSYTYDKKILNKLTNQQCKDYIDNYEDKKKNKF